MLEPNIAQVQDIDPTPPIGLNTARLVRSKSTTRPYATLTITRVPLFLYQKRFVLGIIGTSGAKIAHMEGRAWEAEGRLIEAEGRRSYSPSSVGFYSIGLDFMVLDWNIQHRGTA